jgi:hypothetical protein
MSFTHLMPLGISPGAVTAPLGRLKHTGQSPPAALVLFAARQVKDGRRDDRVKLATYNRYNSIQMVQPFENHNAVDVVLDFLRKEFGPQPPVVHWVEASNYDYRKSFLAAAEVLFRFLRRPAEARPDVRLNLTGGTNVMNAALLQAAVLSGQVTSAYYAHAPDCETFLHPAGEHCFTMYDVPLLKVTGVEGLEDEAGAVVQALLHRDAAPVALSVVPQRHDWAAGTWAPDPEW